LQFIILDEISLVGARILNAINQRLYSIKHVQNNFSGDLNVIVTGDFYQAPLERDKWVLLSGFKRAIHTIEGIDIKNSLYLTPKVP
jgi:hypothetical protein